MSEAALALLRDRAAAIGKTEAALAAELLEAIARDDLYEAVLDDDSDPSSNPQLVEARPG